MGAIITKPDPPEENKAKATNDAVMAGFEDGAQLFLADCRLAAQDGTAGTLGYKIVGDKLQDAETNLMLQTQLNCSNGDITKAVDSLFSGDWEGLAELCAGELSQFLTGAASDTATYKKFEKGYLKYEFGSLVQYSVMVIKSNTQSTGMVSKDTQAILQTVVCKGLIDYAFVDPQVIIYNLQESQPTITQAQLSELLDNIQSSMRFAAKLSQFKKELDGGVIPPAARPAAPPAALLVSPAAGGGTGGNNAELVSFGIDEPSVYEKKINKIDQLKKDLISDGKDYPLTSRADLFVKTIARHCA